MKVCVTLLLVVLWIGSILSPSLAVDRPNIVYILADDLGYGDLGCYGSTRNSTPHIDRLAASGLRLTDFHAASWCAPSRRALMTGCHANRSWNANGRRWGRLATTTTIPELLRSVGYATALIGKWHLEMSKGLHPLDQGFEDWYGTRGSNDWDGPAPHYPSFQNAPEQAWKTPLYVQRENKGPIVSQSQFTKRYTEEAIRWIGEHRKGPFFLYLAHNMPHVPIFASEAFRGKSSNGVYGDVIQELDASVGEIVRALGQHGLRERTIVVFTSDNGPWTMFREFGGVATPLRGEKSTTWEGGERVPCIVSWPGRLRPGVCSALMANYDVYATLASFAGVPVPNGQAIDSLDMSKVLLSGASSPRTRHVYYHHQPMAYRSGNYKIHFFTRERTRDPVTGKKEESTRHATPLLFDLEKDIAESRNIAAEHPDIVERLTKEFRAATAAIAEWKPFQ